MKMFSYLFTFLLFSSIVTADPVVILNWSPTGYPGDVVYVQGDNFGTNAEVLISGPNHPETTAEIVAFDPQSISIIQFVIPDDWYLEAYHVKIRTNESISDVVTMNRPFCQQFDKNEILPGTELKLYGENLYFGAPWQPRVYFIKLGTNESLEASIDLNMSDDHVLVVTTPNDLESDTQYVVSIDNGLGATSTAKTTVTARTGTDYLGLGIGWGVNFGFIETNIITLNTTSNPAYDAFPDIQTALHTLAQKGGGMLLLGEGDFYWLSCKSLQLHGNIVMKGAGVNRTTIYNGYCNITGSWIYSSDPTLKTFAMVDLSIKPGDFEGGFSGVAITGKNFSNIALVRLYLDIETSSFQLSATNVLVQDVTIVSVSLPFHWENQNRFDCSQNLLVRNSWFFYENGYMTANYMKYGVFDNVRWIRDAAKQFLPEGPFTGRGFTCNFCENVVFDRCQLETLNYDFTKDHNDGETILTEGGGGKRGEFGVGIVSSATSTTLTDSSANWALQTTPYLSLTITDGPGFGQTRQVVAATSDTFTIDQPWTVIPTTQSKYSFLPLSSVNWLIKDSLLKGNPRGISLYASSSINTTVVRNTLVNSAGVDYKPYQRVYSSSSFDICGTSSVSITKSQKQLAMAYNSRIINNDIYADNPLASAQIKLAGNQLSSTDTTARGILMMGVEVRGNNITRMGDQSSNTASYVLAMCFEAQTDLPDTSLYSVVGTIIQDNSAQGAPQVHAFGSNIASSVLACARVTNQPVSAVNDTYSLDFNNCRFYPSQTLAVHVLDDQCRSKNYWPPVPVSHAPNDMTPIESPSAPSTPPQATETPQAVPRSISPFRAFSTQSRVEVTLLVNVAVIIGYILLS